MVNFRGWIAAVGLALAAAFAPSAQAQTNLVLNSGFEQGAANTFTNWGGGSFGSSTPDFTGRGGSGRVAVTPCANSGQNVASCLKTQTITNLQVGATYRFSVYAASPDTGGHVYMQYNGATVLDQAFQTTGNNYTLFSTNVVATATSQVIGVGGYAPVRDMGVDDVSFSLQAAAPEPATWGLMILGFGLVGAALRRRPRPAPAAHAA